MSNRKRMKDNRLRLKQVWDKDRLQVAQRALAKIVRPSETPIGRAMQASAGPHAIVTDEVLEAMGVTVPGTEAQVVKVVPAGFDHPETGEKVIVGKALIHDDGQVAIRFDEDAPQWAMDYLQVEAQHLGFNFESLSGPVATPKEQDGSP